MVTQLWLRGPATMTFGMCTWVCVLVGGEGAGCSHCPPPPQFWRRHPHYVNDVSIMYLSVWVLSVVQPLLLSDMTTRLRVLFSVLYTGCIWPHLLWDVTWRSIRVTGPIHIRKKLPLSHNSSAPPFSQSYNSSHTFSHRHSPPLDTLLKH